MRETGDGKAGLVIPNPASVRVRNLHLNFQFTIRELRFTKKTEIPHPQEERIRDDRARAKGRLGAVACHSEEREATRNLDLVPYEPGSCTAEDTEKCKREKQNIWSRYKGRLVTRKSSACHSEPATQAGEESAFELSVHDSRITIHEKDRDPSSARSADSG